MTFPTRGKLPPCSTSSRAEAIGRARRDNFARGAVALADLGADNKRRDRKRNHHLSRKRGPATRGRFDGARTLKRNAKSGRGKILTASKPTFIRRNHEH
ncbi:MAG TPA: hypothetical protein VF762_12190 [Blastocatellia bacterium]